MDMQRIKDHFEEDASNYDAHILKFVPYYREQNAVMMELLPFEATARLRALDLGAGNGVLADSILRRYPHSGVVVFDLAENMIAEARERLAKFPGRAEFIRGDFSNEEFGFGYDLILSGLSIHHLDDETKRGLYHRIYRALLPGGIFLNRDVVRGATDRLDGMYERLWREFVRSTGEDDVALMERYRAEDIPARVEDQLEWLRAAGFVDVGCHWQRLNFAIFGGRKYSLEAHE